MGFRELYMKVLRFDGKHNVTGSQLRKIRQRQGLTQDQVAARLQTAGIQINQKAISRIESGDRIVSDFELLHLAQALSIPIDALFITDNPDE